MATHWKVRPYFLTGGRTRTRTRLLIHTLVSVPHYDALYAASLLPEARSVYEHAREPTSVAELSARCGMTLGVTQVVIDDLATSDRLRIYPDKPRPSQHLDLLERLRDGLLKFA